MSTKGSFEANIRFRLGDGRRLIFWSDVWAGNSALAAQYPGLYACAKDHQAKACDQTVVEGDRVLWGPIFKRNLVEAEETYSRC